MPISLTIECQSVEEYREAIAAVAGAFQPPRESRVWEPGNFVTVGPEELRRRAEELEIPPAPEETAATPEGSGGPVVAREPLNGSAEDVTAALARANPTDFAETTDKAAPKKAGRPRKETTAKPPAAPAPEDLGQDPMTAAPAAQTPAEAKAEALDLLRALYDKPGLPDRVNSLLAVFDVTKFSNIPDSRGAELLAQARALEAQP